MTCSSAKAGSAVIVTGRRQDRMQQFISAHANAAKPVKSYTLDLTKTDTIASWVQKCVEILFIDIES